MTALIANDAELDTLLSGQEVEQVCTCVFEHEGVAPDAEVSVSFVDADEMRGLNATWRGIDAPTDVLSFALIEGEDDEEDVECFGVGADMADAAEGPAPLELGDVILAPEVIAAQSAEFGTTPAEECRLMLVHGLLHLLGYDHMSEDEAAEMEAHELAVLRALAASRGEDPAAVTIGPTTRHEDD